MDYTKVYNLICERGQKRKIEGYTEKHHIIPKCIGGNNKHENLTYLTAKEHFLCHRLLCEIYPESKKLVWAFWLMAIGKKRYKKLEPYKVSARQYENARKLYINKVKGKPISKSHKNKIGKANSKKVHQYTFKGKLIKTFNSMVEAERFMNNKPNAHWSELGNNIGDCCNNRQKSAYGFIWKYEGDILHLKKHTGSINKKAGRKLRYITTNEIFNSKKEVLKHLKISEYRYQKYIKEGILIDEN